MGLFSQDDDVVLENANLECEPQGPSVTKSAVAKIDEHLSPGEKVHYLSIGNSFSINNKEKSGAHNLRLALTDQRIVLKLSTGIVANELRTFNYEDISSVNLRKGMVLKKIAIETQSATRGIGVTGTHDEDELQAMVEFIRKKSRSFQEGQGGNDTDPLDRIDKLKELNEKGAISDEEFEKKKNDLLDQI